jgi:serine/threonine protein kinase
MDVPQIIAGRFRMECEIGKGGMGTVYRATHLGLERPVAVKIIKPEFAADPDVTDRFMREARTMAKLRHPHAAMIFDAGNLPDGRHFIVMEFVEGVTLSETLTKEGRFTPQRAVQIASEICDVLGEAHQLGIVHRDLKPSNIMMGKRGVCVLDFGVAKVLATSTDSTASHATTGSGVIIGTPRYMSPEQCLGQRVEARSDLYSLGVLLYEMLSGRPPFIDALPSAVLVKQATAAPPPLFRLREDVPRSLALAVHTLLAKRPQDRPHTAGAARAMLERSIIQPERKLPEVAPFSSTLAAINTRRPLGLRILTPIILLAVLGAILFAWGRAGQRAEATSPDNGTSGRRDISDKTPADIAPSAAGLLPPLDRAPSPDEARRILASFSRDMVSDVRVVRTASDLGIVALHDERKEGTSHFYVLERRGPRYHLKTRAMLDKPDFRGADWTAEPLDAEGKGYGEVLYTGSHPRQPASGYRLVLYVPRTHKVYSLRVEGSPGSNKLHARLSPNALTTSATPFRKVLQAKARKIINVS